MPEQLQRRNLTKVVITKEDSFQTQNKARVQLEDNNGAADRTIPVLYLCQSVTESGH